MRNDSMNKAGSFRHSEDHVQDLPDLVWISFDLLLHALNCMLDLINPVWDVADPV